MDMSWSSHYQVLPCTLTRHVAQHLPSALSTQAANRTPKRQTRSPKSENRIQNLNLTCLGVINARIPRAVAVTMPALPLARVRKP